MVRFVDAFGGKCEISPCPAVRALSAYRLLLLSLRIKMQTKFTLNYLLTPAYTLILLLSLTQL
jgi:hypothetical protein